VPLYVESPAKVATTPARWRPDEMPERLTPPRVATPFAPVVADPTPVVVPPFTRLNETNSPASGVRPKLKVAVNVAVPWYVPTPVTLDRLARKLVVS
jgi:hypothetical protein